MAVSLIHTGQEYTANAITLKRGTVTDITSVGVYHNVDPSVIPAVGDFTTVLLVKPGDALADGTNIDILSKMGPTTGGSGDFHLAAGDYQRWCLVVTAAENIIRKIDTVSVL